MPGNVRHMKNMISVTEDLVEPEQDHVPKCRCSDTSLNFPRSEWGPAPTCLLNISQAIYKPEMYAMLQAGLPQAAQAVASAPTGAPLSANISYLFYLIKMGEGFLNEAAAQITSFVNQERISCNLGQQLAEDHLALLSGLLQEARLQLNAGMERAGFAAPGKRAVMHQQVGNHVVYMMSPPDGMDIINLNRLKCKHSDKLVDCRTTPRKPS